MDQIQQPYFELLQPITCPYSGLSRLQKKYKKIKSKNLNLCFSLKVGILGPKSQEGEHSQSCWYNLNHLLETNVS